MSVNDTACGSKVPTKDIWQTTESKATELLALEKLVPPLGTQREIRWGQMTKQVLDEHPEVKGSDKLRIIYNRAASIGKKEIATKVEILLHKIGKYGEKTSMLNEFWDWMHNKYRKSRERQLERLSEFTQDHTIVSDVNPVDAIEGALWEYDFHWEDIEVDTKIQNITVNIIRRDVNYIRVEDLMERNPANWKEYINHEWIKYASAAYRRKTGHTRNWETRKVKGSRRQLAGY